MSGHLSLCLALSCASPCGPFGLRSTETNRRLPGGFGLRDPRLASNPRFLSCTMSSPAALRVSTSSVGSTRTPVITRGSWAFGSPFIIITPPVGLISGENAAQSAALSARHMSEANMDSSGSPSAYDSLAVIPGNRLNVAPISDCCFFVKFRHATRASISSLAIRSSSASFCSCFASCSLAEARSLASAARRCVEARRILSNVCMSPSALETRDSNTPSPTTPIKTINHPSKATAFIRRPTDFRQLLDTRRPVEKSIRVICTGRISCSSSKTSKRTPIPTMAVDLNSQEKNKSRRLMKSALTSESKDSMADSGDSRSTRNTINLLANGMVRQLCELYSAQLY